jgi:hypothetical protein
MAMLLQLPPEILELVFHGLGSIDDVHHLARACRKTYDVIRRQNIYVEIMRSVISHSAQHRFDLQLCSLLNLHRYIVGHMQSGGVQFPATQATPYGYSLNYVEKQLEYSVAPIQFGLTESLESLSDATVYDILARYQGLQVLQKIWLERQLKDGDHLAVDDCSDPTELTRLYAILIDRDSDFRDGHRIVLSRNPKTPETQAYTTLNADQKARFHSAVTSVWMLNEIRWVLTNFVYPTRFTVQVRLLERCKELIDSQRESPILDELDRYAVFRFLYHHLLPLHGIFLADRDSSRLPLTFAAEGFKDVTHCARSVISILGSFTRHLVSYMF